MGWSLLSSEQEIRIGIVWWVKLDGYHVHQWVDPLSMSGVSNILNTFWTRINISTTLAFLFFAKNMLLDWSSDHRADCYTITFSNSFWNHAFAMFLKPVSLLKPRAELAECGKNLLTVYFCFPIQRRLYHVFTTLLMRAVLTEYLWQGLQLLLLSWCYNFSKDIQGLVHYNISGINGLFRHVVQLTPEWGEGYKARCAMGYECRVLFCSPA